MSGYYSHVSCHMCGKTEKETFVYTCRSCGGIMETVFNYDKDFSDRLRSGSFTKTDVMPFDSRYYVDLGQGGTLLVPAGTMSKDLGVSLFLKCEHLNPTGSFKDRPVSCGISKALELGYKRVASCIGGLRGRCR